VIEFPIPILGFAAWSGTGKTTLLSQVIPILKSTGLRIALIKHAHHSFDIDHPGKDSHTLRKAGADEIVIASRHRIACVRETPGKQTEPDFSDMLSLLQVDRLDLVLVEGYKMADIFKLELHRQCLGRPFMYHNDKNIIALAHDAESALIRHDIECMDISRPADIAAFVQRFILAQTNKANKKITVGNFGART
jgi:molybdopterin-guanine dinucleotide biosynthesis protein B